MNFEYSNSLIIIFFNHKKNPRHPPNPQKSAFHLTLAVHRYLINN